MALRRSAVRIRYAPPKLGRQPPAIKATRNIATLQGESFSALASIAVSRPGVKATFHQQTSHDDDRWENVDTACGYWRHYRCNLAARIHNLMKPSILPPCARRYLGLALLSVIGLGAHWSPAQMVIPPNWEGALAKVMVVDAARYQINAPLSLAISATRNGCRMAKVEGDRQLGFTVRIDGKAGKRYSEIAAATPVFSADGRSVAYAARNGLDWLWVINGAEGPTFPALTPTSFVFSEDGKHHAYVAIPDDRRTVLMVDGLPKAEGGWEDVMPADMMPLLSRDGSRLAFVETMKAENKMRVNLDEQPGQWHEAIAMVPSSGFGAYTNTLAKGKVIANARQRPMVPSLNFSADGKHSLRYRRLFR